MWTVIVSSVTLILNSLCETNSTFIYALSYHHTHTVYSKANMLTSPYSVSIVPHVMSHVKQLL